MPILKLLDGEHVNFRYWAAREVDLNFFCECPGLTHEDKKKITRVLGKFSKHGIRDDNREKFKPVEDQIYEIKPTSQLRLLGFFHGEEFVIILCVRKKQDDLSPQDVKKAKKRRERYYEEVGT
jgi:phage-related protein